MIPREHQVQAANLGFDIIKQYGIVYLAMEERTGKTLTAIMIAEKSTVVKNVLVVTKKKALAGWEETLKAYRHSKNYTVINYHSVSKVKVIPDLVILDEPHAYLAAVPTPGKIWKDVFLFSYNCPIIYCSATPHAQGYHQLFNQFALTKFSPWKKFTDYFSWFKMYADRDKEGNYRTTRISAVQTVIDYTAVLTDRIKADTDKYFVKMTRSSIGFEVEPEDKLHYVELPKGTKEVYNTLMTKKVLNFVYSGDCKEYTLVCDTPMKLRTSLHMLEGGSLLLEVDGEEKFFDFSENSKINYIKANWGDTEDLVIMYNYRSEAIKLKKHFKHALILQGSAYAEGIDLHKYKHLVVYSQNFSTAQHTQRRARQANYNRVDAILVHFLLVKKAISEQVYKTVALNKTNFVDTVFEREEL